MLYYILMCLTVFLLKTESCNQSCSYPVFCRKRDLDAKASRVPIGQRI